jgi:putative ABC transport system permease protein
MLDNEKLNKQQFNITHGEWPDEYIEMVLLVDENGNVSDYTLYSLGLLSQEHLKEQFNKMVTGQEVDFEPVSFNVNEILGLEFKLLLNTDYYKKQNGIWMDMKNDSKYMNKVISAAETVKIVGIIKKNPDAIAAGASYGMVGYLPELKAHLINKINESEIVKEQKENEKINVFTGSEFSTSTKFDMSSLTPQQLAYFKNMSEQELAQFMQK